MTEGKQPSHPHQGEEQGVPKADATERTQHALQLLAVRLNHGRTHQREEHEVPEAGVEVRLQLQPLYLPATVDR